MHEYDWHCAYPLHVTIKIWTERSYFNCQCLPALAGDKAQGSRAIWMSAHTSTGIASTPMLAIQQKTAEQCILKERGVPTWVIRITQYPVRGTPSLQRGLNAICTMIDNLSCILYNWMKFRTIRIKWLHTQLTRNSPEVPNWCSQIQIWVCHRRGAGGQPAPLGIHGHNGLIGQSMDAQPADMYLTY